MFSLDYLKKQKNSLSFPYLVLQGVCDFSFPCVFSQQIIIFEFQTYNYQHIQSFFSAIIFLILTCSHLLIKLPLLSLCCFFKMFKFCVFSLSSSTLFPVFTIRDETAARAPVSGWSFYCIRAYYRYSRPVKVKIPASKFKPCFLFRQSNSWEDVNKLSESHKWIILTFLFNILEGKVSFYDILCILIILSVTFCGLLLGSMCLAGADGIQIFRP